MLFVASGFVVLASWSDNSWNSNQKISSVRISHLANGSKNHEPSLGRHCMFIQDATDVFVALANRCAILFLHRRIRKSLSIKTIIF